MRAHLLQSTSDPHEVDPRLRCQREQRERGDQNDLRADPPFEQSWRTIGDAPVATCATPLVPVAPSNRKVRHRLAASHSHCLRATSSMETLMLEVVGRIAGNATSSSWRGAAWVRCAPSTRRTIPREWAEAYTRVGRRRSGAGSDRNVLGTLSVIAAGEYARSMQAIARSKEVVQCDHG